MFSNQTPNYGLPQYEQNDTLNVLVDFNGAMETIDSTMKTNELAAASAQSKADGADAKADNNATAIVNLQGAQATDRTDINTLTGNVQTINSLIGNGEPTTTDKTLIGAINEINGYTSAIDAHLTNRYILDAVDAPIATVTADGVKTFNALISDLASAIIAFVAAEPDSAILEMSAIDVDQLGEINLDRGSFISNQTTAASLILKGNADILNVSTGNLLFGAFYHDTNATALSIFALDKANVTLTLQADDSYVPAAGNKLVALANIYEKYDI